MSNPSKPCGECPFRRTIEPGALGGSSVETYLGQCVGPFAIPCHMRIDYSDPKWREKSFGTPQCAGAATFRSAIGADKLMPEGIHVLPPSEEVFATTGEFMSHHTGKPLEQCEKETTVEHLSAMLSHEMKRSGVIIKPKG